MTNWGNVSVMRNLLGLFTLVLIVAGCAPALQKEEPPVTRQEQTTLPPAKAAPGVLVISNDAGVPLLSSYLPLPAPPGSVILVQSYAGKMSYSRFSNPQSFDAMRRYLIAALKDAGWRVLEATAWEKPPGLFQVTIRVAKGGEQKTVILRYEKGNYSVEVR